MPVLRFHGFGDDGVIRFALGDRLVHNPFEVAAQALAGARAAACYAPGSDQLVPRHWPLHELPDPRAEAAARAAMDWLVRHETRLPGDRSLWRYGFDWEFRGRAIAAPWHSAFAQAFVVLACLRWADAEPDGEHLARALRAARALVHPLPEGCCAVLPDGSRFYEELPACPTRILNAHLLALVALGELRRRAGGFDGDIEGGRRALASLLPCWDTGWWSAYDVPDQVDVVVQLLPGADGALGLGAARLGGSGCARALDAAAPDAFAGTDLLAGIDWGGTYVAGRAWRRLVYGPARHPTAVPTGTRQNTYLRFLGVPWGAGELCLELDLHAGHGTDLELAVPAQPDGGFAAVPGSRRTLAAGPATASWRLPVATFNPPASPVYHRFHVQLLGELHRLYGDRWYADLARSFAARRGEQG
jgi:hypothetical protein